MISGKCIATPFLKDSQINHHPLAIQPKGIISDYKFIAFL